MTFVSSVYHKAIRHLMLGSIDWENDEIKVMLLNEDYVIDQQNDEYLEDVSEYEIDDAEYTEGGYMLWSRYLSHNFYQDEENYTSTLTFNTSDVQIYDITISARYAIIYNNTPVLESDKHLIAFLDAGELVNVNNGTFTIDVGDAPIIINVKLNRTENIYEDGPV